MSTVAERLATSLRDAARAYAAGDQVAPCAVLWTDPERLWESAVADMQRLVPELYRLGSLRADERTGPALWLRCVEARVVDDAPPIENTPIFYLPGISREQLRAVEDCPPELAALVELQYRGITWLHVNGREWTPYAFLVSKHGGLDLDVAKDQGTLDSLTGALATVLAEPVARLQNGRLDAEFFNGLLAPDQTGLLLRWMSDAESFRQRHSEAEWKAFCQLCQSEFAFDPITDGPLKAAQLLAGRNHQWGVAWKRYAQTPASYPGILEWLRRAAPKSPSMFDSAEVWPALNDAEESRLRADLEALVDSPQNTVITRLGELEAEHAARRRYAWTKLGLSPLAVALAPLARLATLCASTPGAPTPDAFAEAYAGNGWRVDAAALAALAACEAPEVQGAVLGCVRAVYLPWLETTARHLQQLVRDTGQSIAKRGPAPAAVAGRVVFFVDGLRMDVAQRLAEKLAVGAVQCTVDWEWSTIPSVTPSGKPAVSPIADALRGQDAGDEFAPRLAATGQPLTHDRFQTTLKEHGWQVVGSGETGDPSGSAWAETGALDTRGHHEGWKLARSIDTEVNDLVARIRQFLKAGWTEVIVVTDHGWLLMPGGLPKIELKAFLAEHKWGRAAALKSDVITDVPTYKWHWNQDVRIATPPGAGCFIANVEYSHGGVSLQEMVTPVLRVVSTKAASGAAHFAVAKWTGAKCRVSVAGDCAGVRVDIRTSLSDPQTSLLADKQARETTADGKVTVFLEDDADIGKTAEIVLLDAGGVVIDSLSTTLGNGTP